MASGDEEGRPSKGLGSQRRRVRVHVPLPEEGVTTAAEDEVSREPE